MRNQAYKPLKPTSQITFDGLLVLMQIRIYFGMMFSFASIFFDTYETYVILLTLIFSLLVYSPLIVALVLLYKKRIAFRIWYAVGVSLGIIVNFILSSNPVILVSGIIIEALIILALFKSKFINENYKKHDNETENSQSLLEPEADGTANLDI